MPPNNDFKELFAAFAAEKVEYLVVGAHAMVYYAEPRYTKDLDLWINPTRENAQRVFAALLKFGAPVTEDNLTLFTNPEMVFQLGIAPNRIDILMGLSGLEFHDAWIAKTSSAYEGVPIYIIGKAELIKNKQASRRPQDLLDVERLQASDT